MKLFLSNLNKTLETYLSQNEKTYHSVYGVNALAVYHSINETDNERIKNLIRVDVYSIKSREYYSKYFRFKFKSKKS